MNKQELIKKYEEYENGLFDIGARAACQLFLKDLEQLDEPQKVKVPPAVAVWYEINKDNLDKNIAYLCLNNWGEFINDKTLFNWMSNTDNFIQTLVNMHQFGYEIEKEKQYLVKIKATKHYIAKDGIGKIFFSLAYKESFTKKELEEAGFGWVFDCPGVQIEEVEE